MDSLQDYIAAIMEFINNVLIPLLFGLALLFFVWNAFRYFIYDAGNKDAQDKAKNLALYGIGAFVFLVSLWGIVNMIVSGLGLGGTDQVIPDYMSNTPSYEQSSGWWW